MGAPLQDAGGFANRLHARNSLHPCVPYLPAVAEKYEAPRSAVFDLGVLGDVIATQPRRSEADDTVRLRLLVLSRAQAAALQAPAAGLPVEILDVTIGLDRAYSEAPAPE